MSTPKIPLDLSEKLGSAYKEWANNPDNHINGYTYESSFATMWKDLGKPIFQDIVGEVSKDKN